MIHVIRTRATKQQYDEMLTKIILYIKVAVDVRQGILAGGGELHSDCEDELTAIGCRSVDIWGADWQPKSREVRFDSIINLKPRTNRSTKILDRLSVIRLRCLYAVYWRMYEKLGCTTSSLFTGSICDAIG